MPEKIKNGSVLYRCECGKKWNFQRSALTEDAEHGCACGRAIVIYKGWIYSERKK